MMMIQELVLNWKQCKWNTNIMMEREYLLPGKYWNSQENQVITMTTHTYEGTNEEDYRFALFSEKIQMLSGVRLSGVCPVSVHV